MEDELDMEVELERELAAEQEELLEEEEDELGFQHALELARDLEKQPEVKKPLSKVLSLPANFTFSSPRGSLDPQEGLCNREDSRCEGYCLLERDTIET
jgi:voltage-dependent calcium channel T type alpha-1G